jgi:hypothetical protein
MASASGALKGAGTGAAIGSFAGPLGTGIGAGIGGLIGLFSGGDDNDDATNPEKNSLISPDGKTDYGAMLQAASAGNRQTAKDTGDQSQQTLGPVVDYFKKILGNDGGALLDATKAERGRVIDQYDTARRAVAQTAGRGGGATGAMADSRFAQAESLSDVTSTAKQSAVAGAAQLGLSLGNQSLTANQLASMDLNTILDTILADKGIAAQKRGQTMEMWGGIGAAAGEILGGEILRRRG